MPFLEKNLWHCRGWSLWLRVAVDKQFSPIIELPTFLPQLQGIAFPGFS